MELVKSKGMIIFMIIVFGLTIISSINTKKYDELNPIDNSHIYTNIK